MKERIIYGVDVNGKEMKLRSSQDKLRSNALTTELLELPGIGAEIDTIQFQLDPRSRLFSLYAPLEYGTEVLLLSPAELVSNSYALHVPSELR